MLDKLRNKRCKFTQPTRLLIWKPQWQGGGWPYVDQENARCSFLKITSEACDVNQKAKDVLWLVAQVNQLGQSTKVVAMQ